MKSLCGINAILFDLDNTLYPITSGLQQNLYFRGVNFTSAKLKMDNLASERLIKSIINKYGTIEYGLMKEFDIDPEEYMRYVFDVSIETHLKKDYRLKKLLQEIRIRRIIFSDSPIEHIHKVLDFLEIRQLFEKIYDKRFYNYHSKSNLKVHDLVLKDLKLAGTQCLLIDDNLSNLISGKLKGMVTVWVTNETKANLKMVDYKISNILEIGDIISVRHFE